MPIPVVNCAFGYLHRMYNSYQSWNMTHLAPPIHILRTTPPDNAAASSHVIGPIHLLG